MNSMAKRLSLIFLLMSATLPAFSTDALYKGDSYSLSIGYTNTVFPGDIAQITLLYTENFSLPAVFAGKNRTKIEAKASFCIAKTGQILRSATMYKIHEKKQELIALIPLSTWYENGTYSLKITYQIFEDTKDGEKKVGDAMEFFLPIELKEKEFISEHIQLNPRNTAIKKDTSTERKKQIDRLFSILKEVDKTAIYQTKPFSLPVKQTRRTAFFADRRVYEYSNGTSSTSLHNGIDFGIPTGTPVYSSGDGKVVLAERRNTTGWSVVIEHLPGLYSLYYHLDSFSVKEGDMVKQNQKIGLSGSTGLATGPHLHWEMRLLGHPVNPDLFTNDFILLQKE